ncbi:MAG: hypothetical protein CBC46_02240 [Verrucomicrobiaceae bacterium TMED86]|nr:MAG: hypothetical protein CBC46_02240 [Verrucomicrobiaceae bacterium TMED86]
MCIFLKAASSKTRPGSILKKRDNEFGNASPVGMGQRRDSVDKSAHLDKRTASRILRPSKRRDWCLLVLVQ